MPADGKRIAKNFARREACKRLAKTFPHEWHRIYMEELKKAGIGVAPPKKRPKDDS